MQMPAAVESVGGSESQSESHFAVSESILLRAAASSWTAFSWESWRQWRPSESSYWEHARSSLWPILAEKQKWCHGQEKKLWVNIAICLVSPRPSVSQTTEDSTSFQRIKRRIYSYKEVLYFLLYSSHYTTHSPTYYWS